ncbi:MAG: hypothetical protein J0H39_13945 [Alphaproteobacteria bacterium]|nr:hypothetical protein [Alphaproteobacteria bacterium]
MAAKQLSDYNPDGTILGQAAADKIGFHGTAGTAQVALSATAALATTAATTGAATYGFTSAQANGMIALVNALRAALVTKGLAST